MVRSTLPHLRHWTGLRLILGVPALLHNFDPLTQYFWQKYLTDQEILRHFPKTILELWACLIWAQLDHGKTRNGQEMCRKKCQFFDGILKIWRFFEDDPRSTWNHFKTKKTAFWRKNWWFLNKNSCLRASVGGALGKDRRCDVRKGVYAMKGQISRIWTVLYAMKGQILRIWTVLMHLTIIKACV